MGLGVGVQGLLRVALEFVEGYLVHHVSGVGFQVSGFRFWGAHRARGPIYLVRPRVRGDRDRPGAPDHFGHHVSARQHLVLGKG